MTKRKIALIIVAAILAAILVAVVVCVIIANSKNDDSKPTDDLANWQSMIKDETLLKNVVIAGAHDAGTIGLSYLAATQNRDITDLLNCGTRYLDLRVSYAKGRQAQIYHGPFKGITLESVLDDVKQFLTDHPTESVILDFQHFEGNDHDVQSVTRDMLIDKMLNQLVTTEAEQTETQDVEFVNSLTLADVRGKALVVWGDETYILKEKFVFKRNNDNCTRSNSTLHSYYDGSLNKKSSSYYIQNALPHYLELYKTQKELSKGLKVLQGQLTDGMFIFGPRLREATHTDNMNKYLDDLKATDDLQYINIVIRDFITPSKNCHTLQLNLNKGTVKADSIAAFEKMIADNIVAR